MTRPNDPDEIRDFLSFAVGIAHEAGAVTLQHFGGLVAHEAKSDGSPVTVADRQAEKLLRRRLRDRFPDHAVLGEEMGASEERACVRWILDPIDATLSFMRGVPLYGVLIGVEIDGTPAVGVAHFPALQETVAAGEGLGCTLNGSPCGVSQVERIEDALVLTTDPEAILRSEDGPGWSSLQSRAALARTWGDCYGHALVATGRAEVMIDPIVNPWDSGPFLTILTEAGGRFTTRAGEATIHGGSAVSSNGILHDEVLKELGRHGAR